LIWKNNNLFIIKIKSDIFEMFKKGFVFLLPLSLFAQMTVSGTVSDAATGNALAGANVVVEGTDLGAAAAGDGSYSIANVPAGATSNSLDDWLCQLERHSSSNS
jgi:hypothetical protein